MTLGFSEEKLIFCLVAIIVILAVALVSTHWPSIQTIFSTLVGGVVSIAGIYCGSNVAHNWINKNNSDESSKGDGK